MMVSDVGRSGIIPTAENENDPSFVEDNKIIHPWSVFLTQCYGKFFKAKRTVAAVPLGVAGQMIISDAGRSVAVPTAKNEKRQMFC